MTEIVRGTVARRVGTNIKVARARSGKTQEEVAALLGTSQETVSRWERGAVIPSVTQIFRLAEIFGIDPAWLTMRGEMESEAVAEEILNRRPGTTQAVLEQIKMLPPEDRRELARELLKDLL